MDHAWEEIHLQYLLKAPTEIKADEAIPDDKRYIDPKTHRRGVWRPSKIRRLERGYCHNFNKFNSFNANAELNHEQLEHA